MSKNYDKNQDISGYILAGKLLERTIKYARKITKRDMLLLEIAEKIEEFIAKNNENDENNENNESRASCAFPPNLSIDEIAAHYSPFMNDKTQARGLLKIDVGVMINNCIADAAISIDLEKDKENKNLIKAANDALKAALKVIKPGISVSDVGKAIEEKISKYGFKPIYNLSGHSIGKTLHAGKTIPNYESGEKTIIEENEVIAIEPFVTSGEASGYVVDGKPSSIWILKKEQKPRLYRNIYDFIIKNYNSLPFSQRWVEKVFPNANLALNIFAKQGIMHNYKELIEKTKAKVSQAETTIVVKNKPIVLTNVFDF